MYAFIEGDIAYKTQDTLVVNTNGVGYRIHVSPGMMGQFVPVGQRQTVHTYLSVRDDALVLYGFPGRDELAMFEMLITVSGIGPKVASAIVGDISPSQFALAVISDDSDTLIRARGLGKKGAQRIILELKDKVGKELESGTALTAIQNTGAVPRDPDVRADAVDALRVLGYSAQQASQAVDSVLSGQEEKADLEQIIRSALTRLI